MATRKTGWGGARQGAGGKPKPKREQRRHVVTLRFTDAELRLLREAAGDTPASIFARERLLRSLKRKRKTP